MKYNVGRLLLGFIIMLASMLVPVSYLQYFQTHIWASIAAIILFTIGMLVANSFSGPSDDGSQD